MKTTNLGIALILGSLLTTGAEAKDDNQGWIMQRVDGLGHETMYANSHGILMRFPTVGLNILSKPPNWEAIWYNTKARTQFIETLAEYRQRKGLPPILGATPSFRQTLETYAGVPARVVHVLEPKKAPQSEMMPLLSTPKKERVLESKYYFTEKVSMPDGAMLFLSTFFGTPNYGGIPLGYVQSLSNGVTRSIYSTQSVKKGVIPESIFNTPVGYKKLKTQMEINNGGFTSQMEDLFTDMKVGEDFGK